MINPHEDKFSNDASIKELHKTITPARRSRLSRKWAKELKSAYYATKLKTWNLDEAMWIAVADSALTLHAQVIEDIWDTEENSIPLNPYKRRYREIAKLANQIIDERDELKEFAAKWRVIHNCSGGCTECQRYDSFINTATPLNLSRSFLDDKPKV